jgi:hypothetical protein
MARIRVLLLVPVVVAAVAGCGGSGSSSKPNGEETKGAQQIVTDVSNALAKVKSFHLAGSETDKDGLTTVSGDVAMPGRLHLALHNGDATVELVLVGNDAYIKANRAFWNKTPGAASLGALLADKWVRAPSGSTPGLGQFSALTDPSTIGYCFVQSHHGSITKSGTDTVDGKKAVVLVDEGNAPGATPGKLFVATTGDPLPLRAVQTGPQAPGGTPDARCHETKDDVNSTTRFSDLRLSNYDEKIVIAAPAGAVDLRSLAGGNPSS